MKHPNILFLIADDHRHDGIRYFGNTAVHTPVLDSLAASGAAFIGNRIMGGLNGAVCVPSRACLHSGASVFRAIPGTTVKGKGSTIDSQLTLLAQAFRESGYYSYGIGKWHNDKESYARSFTGGAKIFFGGMSPHRKVPVHDFNEDGDYPAEAQYADDTFSSEMFSEAAVEFLREYRGEQPFFLYVAYTAPHDPRTPPKKFADMYDTDSIELPPNFMPEHPFDNGDLSNRDERLEAWPREPLAIKRHMVDYYGMISHLDEQIGRVLEALQATGQADNTIVVYTADHGLSLGQHGLLGKQNVYDASIRVPLILSGGGVQPGTVVRGLSYTYDIYPTLCELAGIAVPPTVEAQSLLPLLQGQSSKIRETVFTAYKELQRTVTDGKWKLIRYYRSPERGVGSERLQLFDLEEDPWELLDLSADPAMEGHIRRLGRELAEWQRKTADPLYGSPVLPQ